MATQCNDIETHLPTYLDGELSPHDQLSFDHHIADCGECRERVRGEGAYLARVREVLAPPGMPGDLAARLRVALDHEDMQSRNARRRSWRAWALPTGSGLAAAAALLLLVFSERGAPDPTTSDDGEVHAARPVSLGRAQPISLTPRTGQVTWRPVQMQFDLALADGSHHQVQVEVLGCRNVDFSRYDRWIGDTSLWVSRGRVNTVIYRMGASCVVFGSDLVPEQLVPQIVASGLVNP